MVFSLAKKEARLLTGRMRIQLLRFRLARCRVPPALRPTQRRLLLCITHDACALAWLTRQATQGRIWGGKARAGGCPDIGGTEGTGAAGSRKGVQEAEETRPEGGETWQGPP